MATEYQYPNRLGMLPKGCIVETVQKTITREVWETTVTMPDGKTKYSGGYADTKQHAEDNAVIAVWNADNDDDSDDDN